MENRLKLTIFLLGVGAIVEVNPQKWINTGENKRFTELRPNDIDAGDVYQRVSIKKQSKSPWINSDTRQIIAHSSKRENDNDELLKILTGSSTTINFDKLDSIGDQVISHANVSEETKRVARQVKKKRPGFFWTIFRVAFESINDTKSVIQQINEILEANIVPDTTTIKAPLQATVATTIKTTAISTGTTVTMNSSDTATTTTTKKPPYKLTRNTLQNIVRRNLQGLVRLFNIEWKDAISQSQISVREFQNELGKSAQPFLKDNPAAY